MTAFSFIRSQVLARLKAGQFVPVRKNNASPRKLSLSQGALLDRRDELSPLTITKRCIRYEPRVFLDRKDLLVRLANDLNSPDVKIILVSGEQGLGKSSLIRGALEMMGGKQSDILPQLLWFEASRYTDFDDVTQFLVQYIIHLSKNLKTPKAFQISAPTPGHPFEQLTRLLDAMSTVPLLIVLDNLEYLVDSQLKLNSPPFKELLNFLLQYDNIKIIMAGERLPYMDLAPQSMPKAIAVSPQNAFSSPVAQTPSHLDELKIQGLTASQIKQWFQDKIQISLPDAQAQRLQTLTQGYPWLLKTLLYLHQKAGVPMEALMQNLEANTSDNAFLERDAAFGDDVTPVIGPIETTALLIYQDLDPVHRQAAQLMVLARHPLDVPTLQRMIPACFPNQKQETLSASLAKFEKSALRPVLKINYPPQEVLKHLQAQQARLAAGKPEEVFIPSYDLYHGFKKVLYRQMPDFEKIRLHEALHSYYLEEKAQANNAASDVPSRLKMRTLVSEANFHLQMAQRQSGNKESVDVILQSDMAGDEEGNPNFWQTQAYQANLEQHQVEALQPRYSLDDYRKMRGSSLVVEEQEAASLALGNTVGEVFASSGDDTDIAWESLLTEEEKRLLGLTNADFQRNTPASGTNEIASLADKAFQEQSLAASQNPSDLWQAPAPSELSIPKAASEDEVLKTIQHRMTLAVANRNKTELMRELIELAKYWCGKKEFARAEECLKKALSLESAQSQLPSFLLAKIWQQRALIHQKQYQLQASMTCFQHAYQLTQDSQTTDATTAEISSLASSIAQQLSEQYVFQQQLNDALSWQRRSVQHAEQVVKTDTSKENLLRLAETYFRLAQLLDDAEQLDAAIAAYKRSISQPSLMEAETVAAAMSNIGQLYAEQDLFEQAIEWLKNALRYDKQSQSVEAIIETLEAIAVTYEQWADYSNQQQQKTAASESLQKADDMLKEAFDALQEHRGTLSEPSSNLLKSNLYVKRANLYLRRQEKSQALTCYQHARQIGQQVLSQDSLTYLEQRIAEIKAT